jgi:cell division protein FtsQ
VARLRALLGYVPAFLKLLLALVAVVLIFAGYRAAASASFFQVRRIEVQGTSRVSVDEVQALIRNDVAKTGVWKADVKGLNARLEKLPWIRTAVVSRVLPDGIRVRITERVPRAVVRTASGRFRWVDDDAVLLGEMLPTDQIPPFFLRGLNEDDPDGARAENRERVARFLEMQKNWDAAGLSERISEVNLNDMKDIRAQLAGDDSQIEIRLGSQDGKRLKEALDVLDAQRQSPRGSLISYLDLGRPKQVLIGHRSSVQASDNAPPSTVNPQAPSEAAPAAAVNAAPLRETSSTNTGARTAESKSKKDRADKSAADKKADKSKKPERHR